MDICCSSCCLGRGNEERKKSKRLFVEEKKWNKFAI